VVLQERVAARGAILAAFMAAFMIPSMSVGGAIVVLCEKPIATRTRKI